MPNDNDFASGLATLFAPETKETPTLPSADIQNVMKAIMGGMQPGTLEYFKALGAEAEQNGIIPTNKLGPLGWIRDKYSSDAQNIIKKQSALTDLGFQIQGNMADLFTKQLAAQQAAPTLGQASAMMPALSGSATPEQQIRPMTGTMTVPTDLVPPTFDIDDLQRRLTVGGLPDLAGSPFLREEPNAVGSYLGGERGIMPLTEKTIAPTRSLDIYGASTMDPNARMNPAQLSAYQSLLAGHIADPSAALQPPSIEAARLSRQGAMDREMLSPDQQQNVLQNMVAARQLSEDAYQKMLPNTQLPLHKAAFDTFLREMTAGSATTKSSNELAEALFGKPYDQLGPTEQVTAADRQQFKTEEQIRAAGPIAFNRGSAESELTLGGQANRYRRLLPSGEIETAPTTMSHRTANELGYVDTTPFKADIQAIPDLAVLEAQTRNIEQYADALITAVPGLGRFIQGGKLAFNKLTQGGLPTTLPKPDGQPGFLTVGEAANLYESQVQSMLEYYARNLRGVRGAATEGDVGRMGKAFATTWDTKTAKDQKFKEVH